jgi:hypothetical protein
LQEGLVMAEADFTELASSLGSGSVLRGVTAGFAPPDGGGSFVYAWNSIDAADGAHGLYVNLTNFAPITSGGSIRGCLKRAPSGGPLGWSAFLFIGLQSADCTAQGYMLGLNDADPCKVELRKGALNAGLPDAGVGVSGVLRKGAASVALDSWVELRLDMIVEDVGDVRLQCFQNDTVAHPVDGAATWTAISGMGEFVDDALGVNSGSVPFTSGFVGFGYQKTEVTRRAQVDQVEVRRQT